uniref:NADH:ubiquinone oxidoreductase chain 4 N-terminal domain-containing protein n=1 Tax=Nothobranchius furzeri TaxID=105023 RepID=A0A8C6PCS7_NOTFU
IILASQKHVSSEPLNRIYLTLVISLQFFLILAFSATETIIFYIPYPTLILITR